MQFGSTNNDPDLAGDITGWDATPFDEINVAPDRVYFHNEVPAAHKTVILDQIDAVGLVFPDGNETVFVDSDIDVRWYNEPGATYTSHVVSFLEHPDSAYVQLATVGGAAESATVRMPIVHHTTQGRMRVESHRSDGALVTDISDHDFTVTLGFTDYTDDWLRQGHVYSVSWADFDFDGDMDLFRITDYGLEFLTNDGQGRFLWASSGHVGMCNYPRSAAWADYNNDGHLDVYVGCEDRNMLLAGFSEYYMGSNSATMPIDDPGWARGVSWGDYDIDGDVDIFVANANTTNKLFRNDGNWSWSDASSEVAGQPGDDTQGGYWADYDGDRDPDLFVVNFGAADVLYTNNGDGTFTSQTMTQAGNAQSQSADWVDYDNDLDLDLFVVKAYGTDLLYENQGDGTFIIVDRGLGGTTTEHDFMCTWRDVDNFAWQDPYIVSELGDRTYSNVGYNGTPGFQFIGSNAWAGSEFGRVAVSADIDNDGRVDMYVGESKSGYYGYNWLLRNNVAYPGANWLELDLEGTVGNRSAIGSQIEVRTAHPGGGERTLLREVRSGTGHQSGAPLRQHFGLAEATAASVTIRWSSGRTSSHYVGRLNRIIKITEPPPPNGGGGGCPYVYVHAGDEYQVANTVLAPVAPDVAGSQASNVEDAYLVQVDPAVLDGHYELEIREFEEEHSYFDFAQLSAVDHPTGSRVVVGDDGSMSLRAEAVTSPMSAADAASEDVLPLITETDGERFEGEPGDVLTIRFEAVDVYAGEPILIVGTSKILDTLPQGAPGEVITRGIEVLARSLRTGEFVSIGSIEPRELASERFVDTAGLDLGGKLAGDAVIELRLVWHTPHDLDQIAWARPVAGTAVSAVAPLVHAERRETDVTPGAGEDVRGDLAAPDGAFAELMPGEQISLRFEAPEAPPAGLRSYVLRTDGHYVHVPPVAIEEPPAMYRLFAARPNPFNPRTTIGFTLPEAAETSLQVYGVDGRLVRSLVDDRLAAGSYDIVWDGRDDGGSPVSSGVYFYRFVSPAGTDTRRMTLLK